MPKKLKEGFRVGGWEKTSYGLYFFGQNIFYGLVALNVQTLFNDVGITVNMVALILLITKVWDAVNDPLFGVILDKVRFKKGRFMPWLRISLPLIAISSMVLFALPSGENTSMGLKIVWAILGYVAWDMSYTVCDVPIFVLPTSMTDNIQERTSILALGRYLGTIGIVIAMVLVPVLQASLGWFGLGLLYSVLGALLMLPICFSVKERYIVRPEQDVTLQQMFKYVAGNKFLLIFYVGLFLNNVTNFSMSLSLFFARNNLGNQELGTLVSLGSMIPMLIIGALVPTIIKKVDKFHLFFFANIGTAIMGVIRYFVGYSDFGVYMALSIFGGIFASFSGLLVFMFTPDCLEYGTYHTGERAEGIAASVQTFFVKLTGSLAGPLAMLILGAFGFIEGEGAVQPASALSGIWLCMTIFPMIGIAVALFVWSRYKLRDKDVQVMAQYNNGTISKEEAEALLAEKYGPAADLGKMIVTHD